jgi:hypothetical protein
MDPAFAALVLSSVKQAVGSASDDAGHQVWQGLVALVRRIRHRPEQAEIEPAHPEALARTLLDAAQREPGFEAELRAWLHMAKAANTTAEGCVTNTIAPGARVTGNVVQARDIDGPITFH